MTEFELISRYFTVASSEQALSQSVACTTIAKGVGDDAAVVALSSPTQWVTCVDTLVQGRHFAEDWEQVETLAFAIGYKSVAVNVSDIAAMGAKPHSILLALALPQQLAKEAWLSDFAKGLFHACSQFGVQLIGGDTTRSEKLVISVTANGFIDKALTPIYRSGAQVGDKVYVSGTLGDACYALYHPDTQVGKQLSHRLNMPTPRISLGNTLAAEGDVTAMIDVSDGLVQDLSHICEQSDVAVRLHLDKLPTSSALQNIELTQRLRCQLTGGDDYELLFTLPASVSLSETLMSTAFTQITCIGEVVAIDKSVDSRPEDLNQNSDKLSLIELRYQGQRLSKQAPYPFTEYPDLKGYQHFSHASQLIAEHTDDTQ